MLDTINRFKAQAASQTGLSDFGDDWFEAPLAALATDMARPRLGIAGRQRIAGLIVADLCKRLRIIDCLKRNPEIDEVEIPPIVYVTGLARSGTTFLHNLLSLAPEARAFLRWELFVPVPPPEAATYRTDPRIGLVQDSLEKRRTAEMESIHWVNADEPDECTMGAYDCTGILGRTIAPMMPAWTYWMYRNDLTNSYLEYRSLMKLLLWKNPVPVGGYLVLKSPQNARDMLRFSAVMPEARVAIIHRDPFRSVVSIITLLNQITGGFSPSRSIAKTEDYGAESLIRAVEGTLENLVGFVDGAERPVAHPRYSSLVSDPVATIRSILETSGVAPPPDLAERIQAFLASQRGGKRKPPLAVLPEYALEQKTFLARPIIAAYMQRFGIDPEWVRKTGA